jgi:hypothetical protein
MTIRITLPIRRATYRWRWGWPPLRRGLRIVGYVTYEGSSTVWHNVETGQRADTVLEGRLAGLAWLYSRYRGTKPVVWNLPDAHGHRSGVLLRRVP